MASTVSPVLKLQCVDPGTLTLSWPAAPTGYQLESCDNYNSSNWFLVPVTPVTQNGTNKVAFPPTLRQNFYRLHKP